MISRRSGWESLGTSERISALLMDERPSRPPASATSRPRSWPCTRRFWAGLTEVDTQTQGMNSARSRWLAWLRCRSAFSSSHRIAFLGLACISASWPALWSGTSGDVACPLKHGQWEPFLTLTDEFEGDRLDESKWFPNNPGWLGRQPGYFNPKNVRVADGMLHLDAKKESLPNLPDGYHTYTTAFVKGKTKVRYGYFEIRARAMDSQASSAFWFYDITPEIWSEIDVFELGARPQPANYYMNTLTTSAPGNARTGQPMIAPKRSSSPLQGELALRRPCAA